MRIRAEEAKDADAIRAVVSAAFEQAAHSSGTEAIIVDSLREAGALTLSLVAVEGGEVLGHVAVSPVSMPKSSGAWFGLGPVSVHPVRQRQGFGSALIDEALRRLRSSGASGCVVLGDPDYYQRFGFKHDPGVRYRDVPPPYFQILSFGPTWVASQVEYHEAFEVAG